MNCESCRHSSSHELLLVTFSLIAAKAAQRHTFRLIRAKSPPFTPTSVSPRDPSKCWVGLRQKGHVSLLPHSFIFFSGYRAPLLNDNNMRHWQKPGRFIASALGGWAGEHLWKELSYRKNLRWRVDNMMQGPRSNKHIPINIRYAWYIICW